MARRRGAVATLARAVPLVAALWPFDDARRLPLCVVPARVTVRSRRAACAVLAGAVPVALRPVRR
jgi:hypothetical protein